MTKLNKIDQLTLEINNLMAQIKNNPTPELKIRLRKKNQELKRELEVFWGIDSMNIVYE